MKKFLEVLAALLTAIKTLFKKQEGLPAPEPVDKLETHEEAIPAGTSLAAMYARATIRNEWQSPAERKAASIRANLSRYNSVAYAVNPKMPGWFVGLIHMMESDFNFKTHLHNGDSLQKRTVHVPAGRPVNGTPPFEWDFSAVDALQRFKNVTDWSLENVLDMLEKFNGLGYRKYHPHVKSPYLWSGTQFYTKGKYVSDGKWSETAVSGQVGCVAVMKCLKIT